MRMPHLKRVNLHSDDVALPRPRWTLDYPEDLAFIRAVIAAMPPGFPSRIRDILAVIERNPAIVNLNATRNPSIDDASA
jgi:spore coat polysaccharide biosynthesis protein SpsF (cytidylyltransferase family)